MTSRITRPLIAINQSPGRMPARAAGESGCTRAISPPGRARTRRTGSTSSSPAVTPVSRPAARALRKDGNAAAGGQKVERGPDRLAVGLAAADGKGTVPAGQDLERP